MIDYENEIFTAVMNALAPEFPDITVGGEEVRVPPSFPFVSMVEADNYTMQSGIDSGRVENYANVMYEVNVYSGKLNGRKSEAKAILTIIDDVFERLGFTRTMRQPVVMADATKYRLTARYMGVISRNGTIYTK